VIEGQKSSRDGALNAHMDVKSYAQKPLPFGSWSSQPTEVRPGSFGVATLLAYRKCIGAGVVDWLELPAPLEKPLS
jgi:hypothetical protein